MALRNIFFIFLLSIFPSLYVIGNKVNIAIIVYDYTFTLPFISHITPDTLVRPPVDYDRAIFQGALLVLQKTVAFGGFDINGNNTQLELTLYNCNPYMIMKPIEQIIDDVLAINHRFIIMPLSVIPDFDDVTLLVAGKCLTANCLVFPSGSAKRLFVCLEDEIYTAPECANKLGQRRYDNIITPLQDSEQIAETFIEHLLNKQQKSISIFGFTDQTVIRIFQHTTYLIARAGLSLKQNIIFETETLFNETYTKDILNEIINNNADALFFYGNTVIAAQSMILLSIEMEKASYFPHALCFNSVLAVHVDVELAKQDKAYLAEYIYVLTELNKDSRGFSYDAVSTAIHKEVFPVIGNKSSTKNFYQSYDDAFALSDPNNGNQALNFLGASAMVMIILTIEAANGVIDDPAILRRSAMQIDSPSFIGLIHLDAGTGENLQNKLLLQHYKPQIPNNSISYPLGLISVSTSYQSVLPAPNWPVRIDKSRFYMLAGDIILPSWVKYFLLLAYSIKFLSGWSGQYRFKETRRMFNKVTNGAIPYGQIFAIMFIYGFAGNWPFFILCLQSINFKN